MFNFFSTSSLGVEINDFYLRAVLLEKRSKVIKLKKYNEVVLPKGVIENGEIQDAKKASENLKKLINSIRKNGKINHQVIVTLPEEKTFTVLTDANKTVLDLKQNKKTDKIPQALCENVQEYIPFPLEDVYLDWKIVNNKILLSAAPKLIINDYISLFKNNNIFLSHIDIKSAAILRSITSWSKDENKEKIIIYLGEVNSIIILGNNNVIEFSLSLPFANKTITDIIMKKLKLTKEQAQKAKKVCGLSDKNCHGAVKKILIPHLEEVIFNIKKILLFHQENTKTSSSVNEIILCGPGADLAGLNEFLFKKFKISIKIGNPLVNIYSQGKKNDFKKTPKFTVAIGAALRGLI